MKSKDEIEAAVAIAEAETGCQVSGSNIRVCVTPGKKWARRWSNQEDEFVIKNIGKIPECEIAKQLGRSITAVHLRRVRELHIDPPMKDQNILTANHISLGLGVDAKTIHALMDRGIMPSRLLPFGNIVRVADRLQFAKWICDPMNWLYFDIQRIATMPSNGKRGYTGIYDIIFWEKIRQLVLSKRKKWKDDWLTPGQVAKILKPVCGTRYINKAIHAGNLKAVKFQNWKILKSSLRKGMTINYSGDWIACKKSKR